jgi:prepilin-type N-terminal cleavage/methylation domain-containing protein/prepilin-type processing-associated H-X9-DG protein
MQTLSFLGQPANLMLRSPSKSTTMLTTTLHRLAGFTLLELLVVLAVISILIGLVVVGLQSVRSKAQVVSGTSTMRGIGNAVSLYIGEYGSFPGPLFSNQIAYIPGSRAGHLVAWLAPYFEAHEFPANTLVPSFANSALKGYVSNWETRSHYYLIHYPRDSAGNWDTSKPIFGGHPSTSRSPMRPAAIASPSKTAILIDNDNMLQRTVDYPPGLPPPDLPAPPVYGKVRNVLYLDGHVANQKVE